MKEMTKMTNDPFCYTTSSTQKKEVVIEKEKEKKEERRRTNHASHLFSLEVAASARRVPSNVACHII